MSVDDLKANGMRQATAMALNRAADGARVDASREIRSRYRVKVATVNKAFTFQRATRDNLTVIVRVRGRPLNVMGFGARQTNKGVTVDVKGSRKLIAHAFILNLHDSDGNDYNIVVSRKGKARYPLAAVKTVDVPGLFMLEEINARVRELAFDRFDKELRAAVRAVILKG